MKKYYYELLETARLLRQKTQKEVATDTGISQASLSKAEHGLQSLPEESMQRLSNYYDFPISFFLRNEEPSPIGHLYYRRKITVSDKIINSFTSKVKVFKSIIDDIMTSVDLPTYTLSNYIPNEELSASEIARKIRYELKVFRGPIPNLATLLENNGIIIIRFDFGTEKIDGLSSITPNDRKLMFINDKMPNDRIRYSMAHELGHIVMHLENPPVDSETAEREADEFASEFLMPEMEIKPLLERINTKDLPLLKSKWKVSMHAIVRRAYHLEAINYQQYRHFQIWFSKQGYTKREPLNLVPENPTIIEETISLFRNELGYTDQDLMQMMRLNQDDFKNWFCTRNKLVSLRINPIL